MMLAKLAVMIARRQAMMLAKARSYDCPKASYGTLCVVMMLAKLAVMSGKATFEVR